MPLKPMRGFHFDTLAEMFELRTFGRWLTLSALVGIVAGLGACLFFFLLEHGKHIFIDTLIGYSPGVRPAGEIELIAPSTAPHELRPWLFPLIPAFGALIAGLLVFIFAPEAEGHGTDSAIDAFHNKRGIIRRRVPIIKSIASVLTIATGGSAGREGPIAQIGAGFGSLLARTLRLSVRERRLLILAGMSGGIGAIFQSPLAGALFGIEVLYRDDFETEGIVPAFVSSVISYTVFTTIMGKGTLFATDPKGYHLIAAQLPLYVLLGFICAIFGIMFVKIFYGSRDRFFAKIPLPRTLKPMIGAFILGLIGLITPQVFGVGYGWIQEAILPSTNAFPIAWSSVGIMMAIAILKMVATSATISSGGSGGVFGPSLFIGALLGGSIGMAFHIIMPDVVPQPGAFALVGMGAFFGGIAHVPVSSLIMVCELTGSYDLLVPLMLSSGVGYLLLTKWSLYEKQIANRAESPAHLGDFTIDILDGIRVEDVYDESSPPPCIPADMELRQLLRRIPKTHEQVFGVIDHNNSLAGLVWAQHLWTSLHEERIDAKHMKVEAVMWPAVTVTTDESLHDALLKFIEARRPHLPVVAPEAPDQVLGLLSYEDLISAYHKAILKLQYDQNGEGISQTESRSCRVPFSQFRKEDLRIAELKTQNSSELRTLNSEL